MFINSWPSRAALITALQRAAGRGIKDSPLEQREAELLGRDQDAPDAGKGLKSIW